MDLIQTHFELRFQFFKYIGYIYIAAHIFQHVWVVFICTLIPFFSSEWEAVCVWSEYCLALKNDWNTLYKTS